MATVNQNVLIYLNVISQMITYQNSTKNIDDKYWAETILPILYPLWHSDRDKLEVFSAFKDDTYHVTRNKYTRNYKENTGKWVSYEFDVTQLDAAAAQDLRDKLIDAFLSYKETLDVAIEEAMEREFALKNDLNFAKVRLIRNFLLEDSDYIMQPDYTVDADEKALWVTYRQYLRDLLEKGAATAYDVWFPITPTEYLARKAQTDIPAKWGDMGRSDDYLTSTDFHFWKPTANTLANWNQRMAMYMTLKIRTQPPHAFADLYGRDVKQMFGDPLELTGQGTPATYVDNLIKGIENGEF